MTCPTRGEREGEDDVMRARRRDEPDPRRARRPGARRIAGPAQPGHPPIAAASRSWSMVSAIARAGAARGSGAEWWIRTCRIASAAKGAGDMCLGRRRRKTRTDAALGRDGESEGDTVYARVR
jgi:hypothetical protein